MNTATVVAKEFSGSIRSLALVAIKADDKSDDSKAAFYAAVLKEGILPSSIAMYKADAQAISRSTFPKKVQEGVMSSLIRKNDLIKGVKSGRDQVLLKKVAWQNQINKKAERLLAGYPAYIMYHHHKQEKHGVLVPAELDENNRPVKLPKAEKAPEITYLEAAYKTQVHFSNIKTPRTVEVEIAKLSTKMCDLMKGLTTETKKRFSELTVGKKTVEVTAKVKAKK
jgi:hypothetical protein